MSNKTVREINGETEKQKGLDKTKKYKVQLSRSLRVMSLHDIDVSVISSCFEKGFGKVFTNDPVRLRVTVKIIVKFPFAIIGADYPRWR